MVTHSERGLFQNGCAKRLGIGGTTAVALGLALILALTASACNCDNATGPSPTQSTGNGQGLGTASNTIVKGKVVGPDGSAFVGASVVTSSSAFPSFSQKTDDEGEYWSDLPGAGTVTVKVTASGFADQSRSVTASASHSVRADFTLQRQ
jgi:Carboxypeptidase regulatory-like domain